MVIRKGGDVVDCLSEEGVRTGREGGWTWGMSLSALKTFTGSSLQNQLIFQRFRFIARGRK